LTGAPTARNLTIGLPATDMATLDKASATNGVPEQGQLVEVRARPWVVAEVETSALAGPALEPGEPRHLVTLRSKPVCSAALWCETPPMNDDGLLAEQ
jgi:hypothetical protein